MLSRIVEIGNEAIITTGSVGAKDADPNNTVTCYPVKIIGSRFSAEMNGKLELKIGGIRARIARLIHKERLEKIKNG